MLPELLSVMSWEEFISFFQYPFVWRAVVVGTLIALVAALLGVTLVLKRFSFIGDGLSHVAFGAMAVAAVAGLTNQMIVILPVTILAAVLLLRSGRKAKVNGDASSPSSPSPHLRSDISSIIFRVLPTFRGMSARRCSAPPPFWNSPPSTFG